MVPYTHRQCPLKPGRVWLWQLMAGQVMSFWWQDRSCPLYPRQARSDCARGSQAFPAPSSLTGRRLPPWAPMCSFVPGSHWKFMRVSPPSTRSGHSCAIEPFLRNPFLALPPAAPCQSYELIPFTIVLLNIWVPDREKWQKRGRVNSIWASPHCTVCGYWWAWLYSRERTKSQERRKAELRAAEEDPVWAWKGNNGTRGRNSKNHILLCIPALQLELGWHWSNPCLSPCSPVAAVGRLHPAGCVWPSTTRAAGLSAWHSTSPSSFAGTFPWVPHPFQPITSPQN